MHIDISNKTLAEIEREAIYLTIIRLDGNRQSVCDALGMGLRTLWKKIKQYEAEDLDRVDFWLSLQRKPNT